MTQIRQDQRYYILEIEEFFAKIELNPGMTIDCILNDVSISGACIILNKEIFLQREKEYPMQIVKRNGDSFSTVAVTKGKIVWYLSKEFRNKDMIFLGIQFKEKINLPESLLEKETASQ